jgi:hypothetical protein
MNNANKKTQYFSTLALGVLSAMRLHKFQGNLWERNGTRKRDWGNVSEHCLVSVARGRVLADKVGLSPRKGRELALGQALHDFDKRIEILAMKAAVARGESGRDVSDRADAEGERMLREAGFSDDIVAIAGCAGGKPAQLFAMMEILEGPGAPTEQGLALLITHYVDGYARGDAWVDPASREAGMDPLNDIDRRMQKNLDNPVYRKQAEELKAEYFKHPLLRGRGPHENEQFVCHRIEAVLAGTIDLWTGEKIDPFDLPEFVDREIWAKIESL